LTIQLAAGQQFPRTSLLGLPAELRIEVYKLTFATKSSLNALLTCRQLYHEAHGLAYQNMAFTIPRNLQNWRNNRYEDFRIRLNSFSSNVKSNVKVIRLRAYSTLKGLIRKGEIVPVMLIDSEPESLWSSVQEALYDYACFPQVTTVQYIARRTIFISQRRYDIELAHRRLVSNAKWQRRYTVGILKRYEELKVHELSYDDGVVSFTVTATRLDGSVLNFVVKQS
jgi:hypothetical protein